MCGAPLLLFGSAWLEGGSSMCATGSTARSEATYILPDQRTSDQMLSFVSDYDTDSVSCACLC